MVHEGRRLHGAITVERGPAIRQRCNARQLFAYSFAEHRTLQLTVAGEPDLRAAYALCGATFYYALPPDVDGDRSVIRSLDLSQAFASP
ncbi:MAG: hypothetical protein ACREPA_01085 [Candidatus Dormibacteraceae bacterium]